MRSSSLPRSPPGYAPRTLRKHSRSSGNPTFFNSTTEELANVTLRTLGFVGYN
jgi:hypothetical protein